MNMQEAKRADERLLTVLRLLAETCDVDVLMDNLAAEKNPMTRAEVVSVLETFSDRPELPS